MRGEVRDLTRWHARLAVGEQRREESKHVDGTSGPDEKLARGEGNTELALSEQGEGLY